MENEWLRNRGYPHLSDKVNLSNKRSIYRKVLNKDFIAKYAFYPLIHSVIKERRYKKVNGNERAHSYKTENGKSKRNVKNRPLHYSSHLDAIIFGYYSEVLMALYEKELAKNVALNESVIAYRKIPIANSTKNKSTIHFAKEAFDEIFNTAIKNNECIVLKFDIESYFSSIDHKLLKSCWASLLGLKYLPNDHYNIYKAVTRFSYVLRDDLRAFKVQKGKRAGFREKHFAQLRKKGIQSFFESPHDFKNHIKDKSVKVYKYPFRNEAKEPIGIPQGLPISPILANLYLLNFDIKILKKVVNELGGYYRRYSDDIIVVCRPEDADHIEHFIKEIIKQNKVSISESKTEKFLFKKINDRVTSIKLTSDRCVTGTPFTYLGFEYYGNKTLIKSANLAKFYRRMIYSVKRKVKRALSIAQTKPYGEIIVFKRQLYKLYTSFPLTNTTLRTRTKYLSKNSRGEYTYTTKLIDKKYNSNYLSYVYRASKIIGDSSIQHQIRKHYTIFNKALNKHIQRARLKL